MDTTTETITWYTRSGYSAPGSSAASVAAPPKDHKQKAYYAWHNSPFGPMIVISNKQGLLAVAFARETGQRQTFNTLCHSFSRHHILLMHSEPAEQSQQYVWQDTDTLFTQNHDTIPWVVYSTAFEKKVWQALLAIPFASTVHYSDIARAIGMPKAVRAVAAAIGRNPLSWLIPCHRVIGKSGKLHGYRWGLSIKQHMLEWEQKQLKT